MSCARHGSAARGANNSKNFQVVASRAATVGFCGYGRREGHKRRPSIGKPQPGTGAFQPLQGPVELSQDRREARELGRGKAVHPAKLALPFFLRCFHFPSISCCGRRHRGWLQAMPRLQGHRWAWNLIRVSKYAVSSRHASNHHIR